YELAQVVALFEDPRPQPLAFVIALAHDVSLSQMAYEDYHDQIYKHAGYAIIPFAQISRPIGLVPRWPRPFRISTDRAMTDPGPPSHYYLLDDPHKPIKADTPLSPPPRKLLDAIPDACRQM